MELCGNSGCSRTLLIDVDGDGSDNPSISGYEIIPEELEKLEKLTDCDAIEVDSESEVIAVGLRFENCCGHFGFTYSDAKTFESLRKEAEELLKLSIDYKRESYQLIRNLLDDIANKHDVKNIKDFTCDKIKDLAKFIEWRKE